MHALRRAHPSGQPEGQGREDTLQEMQAQAAQADKEGKEDRLNPSVFNLIFSGRTSWIYKISIHMQTDVR
jgi:hypothetical protein